LSPCVSDCFKGFPIQAVALSDPRLSVPEQGYRWGRSGFAVVACSRTSRI
jgi:hypothetical protein